MAEKEPKIITFPQCPVCGSKERYCESLGNQEKARGHMGKELSFCFQVIEGICLDKAVEPKLPMGTTLPAYHVTTDICMGYPDKPCGTVYVTRIIEGVVMKQPQIVLPGQQGGFKMPPFHGTSKPTDN